MFYTIQDRPVAVNFPEACHFSVLYFAAVGVGFARWASKGLSIILITRRGLVTRHASYTLTDPLDGSFGFPERDGISLGLFERLYRVAHLGLCQGAVRKD